MLVTVKLSKANYKKFQNNLIYIDFVFNEIVPKLQLHKEYNDFLTTTKEHINLDDYVAKYTCLFSCYDVNFLQSTKPNHISITKTNSSVVISIWLEPNILDKESKVYEEYKHHKMQEEAMNQAKNLASNDLKNQGE